MDLLQLCLGFWIATSQEKTLKCSKYRIDYFRVTIYLFYDKYEKKRKEKKRRVKCASRVFYLEYVFKDYLQIFHTKDTFVKCTIVYLENIKSTSFLVGLYNINIVFRKLWNCKLINSKHHIDIQRTKLLIDTEDINSFNILAIADDRFAINQYSAIYNWI